MTSTNALNRSTFTPHSDAAYTVAIRGQVAKAVAVTARIDAGLPAFDVTGLCEPAVRELRVRVRSAIGQAGFGFPGGRTLLTFATPVPMDGTAHDLAGAICILDAAGQLADRQAAFSRVAFYAELSLAGDLRPCRGAFPAAVAARNAGLTAIVVAQDNLAEASLSGITVYAANTLREVIDHLTGNRSLPTLGHVDPALELASSLRMKNHQPDFADVRGQPEAVRAMEVAAAGGHPTLLIGAPGSGKTMLARRLPSILPPLTLKEALEVTTLASVAGLNVGGSIVARRPFRAPHHSTTAAGLVGGGAPTTRPGEVSLAHHGVLFLDEVPEFSRQTLEYLREPLKTGLVELSRTTGTVTYEARAQVVAGANPCPCGMLGHPRRQCRCSSPDVQRFTARVEGPLGEVFSIRCRLAPLDVTSLETNAPAEASAAIRERVVRARERQLQRAGKLNSVLTNAELGRPSIDASGAALLQTALAAHRVRQQSALLAVARTIADLADADVISSEHLAEALTWQ